MSTIEKLARMAAKEDWPLTRLRAEIKRIKDPAPRAQAAKPKKRPYVVTEEIASLNLARPLARAERDDLGPQLTKALLAIGFTMVVIGDTAA